MSAAVTISGIGGHLQWNTQLDERLRPAEVAQAMGVSVRTVYKWLRRFREEGLKGLQNRSSRHSRCPHRTSPALTQQVLARRRQRQTDRQIAEELNIGLSIVARLVKTAGLNRLSLLDPPRPDNR